MKRCRHCHHTERTHYPQGCWVLVNATRQTCGCRAMVWSGYEGEEGTHTDGRHEDTDAA